MENKDQYNQPGGALETPVTRPEQITTRTHTDVKIQELEEQLVEHHREIMRLRREVNRLKNAIDDVTTILRNRG